MRDAGSVTSAAGASLLMLLLANLSGGSSLGGRGPPSKALSRL